MFVNDNTILEEDLSFCLKNVKKKSAKAGEKLAARVMKNPGRALEIEPKIDTAAVSKNPLAVLSTIPEVRILEKKPQSVISSGICIVANVYRVSTDI